VTLAGLTDEDCRQRLAGEGLLLQTGPFTVRVYSDVDVFTAQLRYFYSHFPVVDTPAIADFHVQISRPPGLRHWWRPQVQFLIDGQAPFQPFQLDHAFPLFEWGLNWTIAMQAQQYLMLHSAVVERSGKVMLLPAWPGCGKSTLCAALVSRGWRLFSDEFGLVSLDNGQLIPLPRPTPLKNKSIEVIRDYSPDAEIGPAYHGTRKGTVAHLRTPDASVRQSHVPAPPGWLVFPRYKAGAALRMEPASRPQAFLKLANNSFNYQLLGLQGFLGVTRLVRNADCYILSYSDLDEAVDTLTRLADK